jgi:hypothetical protein
MIHITLWLSLKLRRYDIQAAWYTLALLIKCFDISEGSNIIKPLSLVESTFSRKTFSF